MVIFAHGIIAPKTSARLRSRISAASMFEVVCGGENEKLNSIIIVMSRLMSSQNVMLLHRHCSHVCFCFYSWLHHVTLSSLTCHITFLHNYNNKVEVRKKPRRKCVMFTQIDLDGISLHPSESLFFTLSPWHIWTNFFPTTTASPPNNEENKFLRKKIFKNVAKTMKIKSLRAESLRDNQMCDMILIKSDAVKVLWRRTHVDYVRWRWMNESLFSFE